MLELKPLLDQQSDILVIARPNIAGASQAFIKKQLVHVLGLAKLLKDEKHG